MARDGDLSPVEQTPEKHETPQETRGRIARIMSAAERAIRRARGREETQRQAIERAVERARAAPDDVVSEHSDEIST